MKAEKNNENVKTIYVLIKSSARVTFIWKLLVMKMKFKTNWKLKTILVQYFSQHHWKLVSVDQKMLKMLYVLLRSCC